MLVAMRFREVGGRRGGVDWEVMVMERRKTYLGPPCGGLGIVSTAVDVSI